jgi:hypothetical protein
MIDPVRFRSVTDEQQLYLGLAFFSAIRRTVRTCGRAADALALLSEA